MARKPPRLTCLRRGGLMRQVDSGSKAGQRIHVSGAWEPRSNSDTPSPEVDEQAGFIRQGRTLHSSVTSHSTKPESRDFRAIRKRAVVRSRTGNIHESPLRPATVRQRTDALETTGYAWCTICTDYVSGFSTHEPPTFLATIQSRSICHEHTFFQQHFRRQRRQP